jgi:hypothetical protein
MSNPATCSTGERPPTVIAMARAAMARPGIPELAQDSLRMFRHLCEQPMLRIPGGDTELRPAIRIHLGMSAERAAAHEYCYRWHLCLNRIINYVESRSSAVMIHADMCYPAPRLLGQ